MAPRKKGGVERSIFRPSSTMGQKGDIEDAGDVVEGTMEQVSDADIQQAPNIMRLKRAVGDNQCCFLAEVWKVPGKEDVK